MDKDKLNLANRIIAKMTELLDLFDQWVIFVKADDMENASKTVKKANQLRADVADLKKEYAKLNKKSGIILLNNNTN